MHWYIHSFFGEIHSLGLLWALWAWILYLASSCYAWLRSDVARSTLYIKFKLSGPQKMNFPAKNGSTSLLYRLVNKYTFLMSFNYLKSLWVRKSTSFFIFNSFRFNAICGRFFPVKLGREIWTFSLWYICQLCQVN